MWAWVLVGVIAYLALVLFVARCLAFGMGTLPPKEAQKQIVLDVFDGKAVR